MTRLIRGVGIWRFWGVIGRAGAADQPSQLHPQADGLRARGLGSVLLLLLEPGRQPRQHDDADARGAAVDGQSADLPHAVRHRGRLGLRLRRVHDQRHDLDADQRQPLDRGRSQRPEPGSGVPLLPGRVAVVCPQRRQPARGVQLPVRELAGEAAVRRRRAGLAARLGLGGQQRLAAPGPRADPADRRASTADDQPVREGPEPHAVAGLGLDLRS